MKKIIIALSISVVALSAAADNFSVSESEKQKMTEEAEEWMDNIPDGLQDRLSDAVNHAIHGFYSELENIRNFSDTTGMDKYKVEIKDLKTGVSNTALRYYYTEENETKETPLLIYFHGGGWSMGSLETSEKFCRALASSGKLKVISVDYPLAPEHPYPDGVNVCLGATEYLYNEADKLQIDPGNISLGGEGAGGTLALETYLNLPDKYKVSNLIMYYPMLRTQGSLDKESKREFGRGYGFDSRLWETFIEAYKGESLNVTKPLPPTLLISAERDILIKEEKNFSSQDKNIVYVEFPEALHGFISDGHQPSAFSKAVELTEMFILDNPRKHDQAYKVQ